MIRFYGSGLVWNPKTNKASIQFVNDQYETKDEKEIALLRMNGFREEFLEDIPEITVVEKDENKQQVQDTLDVEKKPRARRQT